jgi:aryl-alcohol dehydrogenase-like predicted oxidoreductase
MSATNNGLTSFPIGLGCMAMSGMYGPSDEAESIATIHLAIDRGVTLLDTGDFYGMGHNEMLLGKALAGGKRDRVFIQVKFGAQRDPAGAWLGYDARPAAVKTWLAYTLRRLNTDHIDLYQPARLDPNVPIEETIGAIAELIQAGYVRHVGLSEMGRETIRRANTVHRVTSLQLEYSLMSRGIEATILPTMRELHISATAYGVLSRGLLAGKRIDGVAPGDIRTRMPRWRGENLERNLAMVDRLAAIARQKNATPTQLAMAWVLSRGADIVPLAGARTRAQLQDLLGALNVSLSADDLARIEAAVPAEAVAGARYDEHQMAMLDSER